MVVAIFLSRFKYSPLLLQNGLDLSGIVSLDFAVFLVFSDEFKQFDKESVATNILLGQFAQVVINPLLLLDRVLHHLFDRNFLGIGVLGDWLPGLSRFDGGSHAGGLGTDWLFGAGFE